MVHSEHDRHTLGQSAPTGAEPSAVSLEQNKSTQLDKTTSSHGFGGKQSRCRLQHPARTGVGAAVGRADGDDVGRAVGDALGEKVGRAVGDAVGDVVGGRVGEAVGDAEGDAVGASVGNAVGASVGSAVGVAVGNSVGAAVGACVGHGTAHSTGHVWLTITLPHSEAVNESHPAVS